MRYENLVAIIAILDPSIYRVHEPTSAFVSSGCKCVWASMALSKNDPAFSITSSFDAIATVTVNGVPAVGVTQLISYWKQLPTELPRGGEF